MLAFSLVVAERESGLGLIEMGIGATGLRDKKIVEMIVGKRLGKIVDRIVGDIVEPIVG